MTQDHPDHGASNKPMNPSPDLDGPQTNSKIVFEKFMILAFSSPLISNFDFS